MEKLGQKLFTLTDQERFAAFSGDRNPMHLDPLSARRTQAGEPVVHGMHLLIWALDSFAQQAEVYPPPRIVRAQFSKFVYLGEAAELVFLESRSSKSRLAVSVDGEVRLKITLAFEGAGETYPSWAMGPHNFVRRLSEPNELTMGELSSTDPLAINVSEAFAESMFRAASHWLHAKRIAAIAATSYLVGMVSPGLHSLYSGLSLELCPLSGAENHLAFRTARVDTRVRYVEHEVAGAGIKGTVASFMRIPPTQQASMRELSRLVAGGEFAGARALIAGGSRGLGELTAKLLAAGGANVVITWRTGEYDANRVKEEIREAGGICTTTPYDALMPAAEQLANTGEPPTHGYYFATPPIFKQHTEVFTIGRFDTFLAYYVRGFWQFATYLRERNARISLFYPSSVSVNERPRGMTEYAMAKAAGEALCADMNMSMAPLHVTQHRLPRLPTDQTASISEIETEDPIRVMLRVVRDTHSWPH